MSDEPSETGYSYRDAMAKYFSDLGLPLVSGPKHITIEYLGALCVRIYSDGRMTASISDDVGQG